MSSHDKLGISQRWEASEVRSTVMVTLILRNNNESNCTIWRCSYDGGSLDWFIIIMIASFQVEGRQ